MKGVFVNLEQCLGCKNCEVYCAVEHSGSKNLFTAIFEKPFPVKRINVEFSGEAPFPVQCRHCQEPPCVDACPSGAMKKDLLTGIVSINQDKCIGCWMCAMVCPFGVIALEKETKLVLKCDRCPDRDIPVCVTSCPTHALLFGEFDEIMKKTRKKITKLILSPAKKEIIIGGTR